MSQRALICGVMLFCLKIVTLQAQSFDLNPEKTVNPATGEMGFSLPLGTVPGVSGQDYTATLNYSAGIRYQQEASSAGLGFNYEPGSISRQVVYVPDNNTGGSSSYLEEETLEDCDLSFFRWVTIIGSIVYGVILAIITGGQGMVAAIMMSLWANVIPIMDACHVEFGAPDFLGGGAHTGTCVKFNSAMGQGYFKGGQHDLPDIYFLNTPYINGQMRPVGPPVNGIVNFIFTQQDNPATIGAKVEYDLANEQFKITTGDGSILYLGGTSESVRRDMRSTQWLYTGTYGTITDKNDNVTGIDYDIRCYNDKKISQRENIASQWLLRKVISPDYVDGDGDNNPLTSPELDKGNWVTFSYTKTHGCPEQV